MPTDAPWWAGLGPVGGAVLIVLGLGAALFLFLGGFDPEGDVTMLHGAAKVVAIGAVVAGGALISRSRRGGGTGSGAE
ncbi:hypothetical protein FM076_02630 [Streptomyces albus subsp. chlorinus]|nr:hypothetical protein [Streptomyces albus subsp. chlorinus]